MKLRIEITCDNAAFSDEPGWEASWILSALCDRIGRLDRVEFSEAGGVLMDNNGNRVGDWDVYDCD